MVKYPPPNISVQNKDEVYQCAKTLVDDLLRELTKPSNGGKAAVGTGAESKFRDIEFRGDLDEVNEFFDQNRWTDGLPIVPPTIEAVEAMLNFTDHSPEDVVGVLRPGRCEATVWKIAVNGVMAGCRPEYMPVLLALIEAVAEESFHIRGFNSTGGPFPLIIINGPIIKELEFNHGQGVFRARRRANITISRFLSLCMINIARLRLGETDMATFDRNYYPVVAEAEDESPWEPLSVEFGFKPGSNVVTVQSARSLNKAFMSVGDAAEQLQIIARETARQLCGQTHLVHPHLGPETSPAIFLSPLVASMLAEAGYSKADVKQYLYEKARVPAHQLDEFYPRLALLPTTNPAGVTMCELVRLGRLPKHFCLSEDPNRILPVVQRPEEFVIVVTGQPTRNRNRILPQNGKYGKRVSKEIRLPANWQQLLKKVQKGS